MVSRGLMSNFEDTREFKNSPQISEPEKFEEANLAENLATSSNQMVFSCSVEDARSKNVETGFLSHSNRQFFWQWQQLGGNVELPNPLPRWDDAR